MQNTSVTDNIKYIGVYDTDIDLFENQYVVPEGISYNSYVILDEKIAVMDTVDKCKTGEWLINLERVLAGRTPDYLVVNHLEPDHAGSMQVFFEKYPKTELVCTDRAYKMFSQFFTVNISEQKILVKEGQELSLGTHVLTFMMAPMVHWPEVMVTYEKTEKVLFSADAFGKFGAVHLDERMVEASTDADEKPIEKNQMAKSVSDACANWTDEARRYFINIVGKYGAQVQAMLKKATALDIQIICPLHGPVLTENLSYYLEKYNIWSSYQPEEKGIVIAHASIHGNTAKAVQKLASILKEKGTENIKVYDLARDDMPLVIAEAFRFDRLVLACATYDGGLFPPMESLLTRLKSKNYQKRAVGIIENGSWAPTAGRQMTEILSDMKEISIAEPTVTIFSTLDESSEAQLRQLAEVLTTNESPA